MISQEIKTLENQNPIHRLGKHGVEGGPGRPKGLKNRFTQIKQDMLEVWVEENGKERFRELLKGSKADFIRALDKIVAIMPKEPISLDHENEALQDRIIQVLRADQKGGLTVVE